MPMYDRLLQTIQWITGWFDMSDEMANTVWGYTCVSYSCHANIFLKIFHHVQGCVGPSRPSWFPQRYVWSMSNCSTGLHGHINVPPCCTSILVWLPRQIRLPILGQGTSLRRGNVNVPTRCGWRLRNAITCLCFFTTIPFVMKLL